MTSGTSTVRVTSAWCGPRWSSTARAGGRFRPDDLLEDGQPGPSGAVGGSPISNCRMRSSTLTVPSSKRTFWPPWARFAELWRSGSRGPSREPRRFGGGGLERSTRGPRSEASRTSHRRDGPHGARTVAVAMARPVPRTAARMRRRDTMTPVEARILFPGGPVGDGQLGACIRSPGGLRPSSTVPPKPARGCACGPRSAAGPLRRGCRPGGLPRDGHQRVHLVEPKRSSSTRCGAVPPSGCSRARASA